MTNERKYKLCIVGPRWVKLVGIPFVLVKLQEEETVTRPKEVTFFEESCLTHVLTHSHKNLNGQNGFD